MKTPRTLLFAISWTCSVYSVTEAQIFVSAGYQATVALREMKVDQLAKEILDQDIDPLASVHNTDSKPLVNSYIQRVVQTKWGVVVHSRDLYLMKPTLGQPNKFQHLTRAEEVIITRLRIGHTKATKSHILSRGPPTACQHCGQTLSIDHMHNGVCSVTGMPWRILHCWLIEYSLWDNSWDMHSGIPTRSGILLCDMNG